MKQITATLKSVNKFGLGAIIVTAGLLMGFKASEIKFATVKWRFNSTTSQWVMLPNDNYYCDGGAGTCTNSYDEGVNPNAVTNPIVRATEDGSYTPL